MGTFLLTETMARHPALQLASYDRLFPNQDTLPRGGFGNLIALPLQRAARAQGNTEFVDHDFRSFPDQWSFLASVHRLDDARVEALAAHARQHRRVLGVRFGADAEPADSEPWTRLPSGEHPLPRIDGPLPARVAARLAQRIYITRSALPAPLLHHLKRLAAFQNPEFYRRQAMRRSTLGVPRVISCAEDHAEHLALPRGCLDDLRRLLHAHQIALETEDQRAPGTALALAFRGQLTAEQAGAVRALLAHDTGVLVAPPGAGKTVMGAALIAARRCSALVLVHRRPLLEQWRSRLAQFLGLAPTAIGTLGGGRQRATGHVDVAMIQSLVRGGRVEDCVSRYGHVLVDECHHVPAASFERVLAEVRARYVAGLTATPDRRDGHQPILTMQCGPVRHVIAGRGPLEHQRFDRRVVVRETAFRPIESPAEPTIQDIYAALAADEVRNARIVEDVICALAEGRSPLVLTERREHLLALAQRLGEYAQHVVVLHGAMGARARASALARLATIPRRDERVVLATGRYVGEGFDDARLDTLFLAMPVAWKGTLIQYAGRLHRADTGKIEARVYDYVDGEVPVLRRMFAKRQRGYRALGYQVEDPLFAFTLDGDGPDVFDSEPEDS
jgi:superfamily II DNA or RNA helicase